jgi:hypothetical protein
MSEPESNSGNAPSGAQPQGGGGQQPSGSGGQKPDGSIFPMPKMEVVTADRKPASVKAPPSSGKRDR